MSGIPYIEIDREEYLFPEIAAIHAEQQRNQAKRHAFLGIISVTQVGSSVITMRVSNAHPMMIQEMGEQMKLNDHTAMLMGQRVRKSKNGYDPSLTDYDDEEDE